jgi:ceramide glucosyltransferase
MVAAVLVLQFPRPPTCPPLSFPPVTIFKPLHGNEPGLFSRLVSFALQRYPGPVQLLCGTQAPNDPAIDVVTLLATTQPDVDVCLNIDKREHGTNRKVSNLINMQPAARHDVLVFSDSDIVVSPDFLNRIIAELGRPGVGAVSCAYFGIPAGGVWSIVSALYVNSYFLPNVIAAIRFDAARPCFGAAIALRRNMLDRIGRLQAFGDELADDFAIGSAIRESGHRVIIPRFAVGHVCCERSFRSVWDRQVRSARTIRSIDPIGAVGLIFMHPLSLSLIAMLIGTPHARLTLFTSLACRILLNCAVERAFGLSAHTSWLLPLHDLIAFATFVASFIGSSVVWRGHSYRVSSSGLMDKS